MSQSGKLVPDVDQHHQSTKILNLTVLQRIDPLVDEILLTVAHVTLYGFNLDLLQWSRKDVEGPLFVVKRNTQPRFQFIVMNRRNTDNLVEDLLGDFEYDVQVPYLLYRNATQEVNGIWFYNEHDCEAVANLLSRIVNAYSKVPPESKVSSTKSDFDEAEAAPTKAAMEGSAIPHAPEDSFLKFFSAATSIGNESKPHQLRASVPMYSHASISSMSTLSSTPLMPPFIEPIESRPTNLVKPSLFTPPPSSRPTMPISSSTPYTPLLRHPYDAPLLQPLPPAAPMITRERVRDALSRLVQNNQFIDMVYHEMLCAHYS